VAKKTYHVLKLGLGNAPKSVNQSIKQKYWTYLSCHSSHANKPNY